MCVTKCCPEGKFYGKQGCIKKPSNATPVHYHDFFKNVSIQMRPEISIDALNAPGS